MFIYLFITVLCAYKLGSQKGANSIWFFFQTVRLPLERLTSSPYHKIWYRYMGKLKTICAQSYLNAVTLRWLPNHRVFEEDEKMDQLAKEVVGTLFTGPEPVCGIGWSTSKRTITLLPILCH